MYQIQTHNLNVSTSEYPEFTDEFWQYFGGFRGKMTSYGGDCFVNNNFNKRLYELIPGKSLKVLDLGCGGGCSIEEFIKEGHSGVGLDANPWYGECGLQAWSRISGNLFQCDLTKPFSITEDGVITKFDVITTWECLEHIHEDGLATLADNIVTHSHEDTWLIFSASQRADYPHHKTIHDKEWWINFFTSYGFVNTDINFDKDVIRWESDSIIAYMKMGATAHD